MSRCNVVEQGLLNDARDLRARYLIDASGRNSFIGTKFKLKKNYEHLQKFSDLRALRWCRTSAAGRDGTLTRMVRGVDRWFWIIPLTPERTSIGVVLDTANFRDAKQNPEEFLEEAIAEQPNIMQRDAKRAGASRRFTAPQIFPTATAQLTGDRWMLAGDAAGFIDPVFSSGVFLADARR